MEKKRYILQKWFRTEDIFDTLEKAEKQIERDKNSTLYKDFRITEITETYREIP